MTKCSETCEQLVGRLCAWNCDEVPVHIASATEYVRHKSIKMNLKRLIVLAFANIRRNRNQSLKKTNTVGQAVGKGKRME